MSFDLETKNFENMVHHNSSKLRLIQKGWSASRVFTLSERKRLKREGILLSSSSINDGFIISKKAAKILKTIRKL